MFKHPKKKELLQQEGGKEARSTNESDGGATFLLTNLARENWNAFFYNNLLLCRFLFKNIMDGRTVSIVS